MQTLGYVDFLPSLKGGDSRGRPLGFLLQPGLNMNPASLVELSDVVGTPKVKMALPVPLRVGDRIHLNFQLKRTRSGRNEVLDVSGDWRATHVSFDGSQGLARQILTLKCEEKPPTWRAVKKQPSAERKLGPTRFPRTTVG